MLNRGVLIVRPKQPYLDWAAGLDDSGLVPDPNDEKTVYLIPSFDSDEQAWKIVEQVYSEVFENELYGWHTDETALSFILSWKTFATTRSPTMSPNPTPRSA